MRPLLDSGSRILAGLEFGGFRAWLFLSLAVAKIDLFSGFVFLLLNISHGSGF